MRISTPFKTALIASLAVASIVAFPTDKFTTLVESTGETSVDVTFPSFFKVRYISGGFDIPVNIRIQSDDHFYLDYDKSPFGIKHVWFNVELLDHSGTVGGTSRVKPGNGHDHYAIGFSESLAKTHKGIGRVVVWEAVFLAMQTLLKTHFVKGSFLYYASSKESLIEMIAKYTSSIRKGMIRMECPYEALGFCHEIGFDMFDPNEKILIEPLFLGYEATIDEIVEFYRGLEKKANKYIDPKERNVIEFIQKNPLQFAGKDTVGFYFLKNMQNHEVSLNLDYKNLKDRFRQGLATEHDLQVIQRWYSTDMAYYDAGFDDGNIAEQYKEFKAKYPENRDYLDITPFEKSAKDVIEDEKRRYKLHSTQRKAQGFNYVMTLDEKRFQQLVLAKLSE